MLSQQPYEVDTLQVRKLRLRNVFKITQLTTMGRSEPWPVQLQSQQSFDDVMPGLDMIKSEESGCRKGMAKLKKI